MSRAEQPRADDLDAATSEELEAVRVFDAYLARIQAGHAADPERLLAEHPTLAAPLQAFLNISHLVDRAVGDVPPALEDYRIVREVGRGGMAIVYEAEQISTGCHVALKVLPLAAALDPRQLQRFQVEVRAAQLLRHPSIVPIGAFGCERGVYYYAMQYIAGQSLAERITGFRQAGGNRTSGRVDREDQPAEPENTVNADLLGDQSFFRKAARWGQEAAAALDHAHGLGVLHRDIKPSNLLVDGRDHLWVTDFGLAQIHGEDGLTKTGDLLGTLRYMSPEQALGRRVLMDGRTDIYALGATLYELLTLRPAFESCDRQELLRRIAFEEPRPPRRIDPAIPRDLETIVLKAMAKEREERYTTAQELAEDLRRFLEGAPIEARRPGLLDGMARWARRHRAAVVAGIAILIAAVATLLVGNVLLAREQSRTMAAKELAEARERESRCESLVQHIQRIRLTPHHAGWSQDAWALAREAVQTGGTDQVQAEAAASLAGLDARPVKVFPTAASALSFHPQTGRLLTVDREGRVQEWDAERDQSRELGAGAPGLFAVTGDGRILLLSVVHDHPGLELRDVLRGQLVRTLPLSGAADGVWIASAWTPDGARAAGAFWTWDGQDGHVVSWNTSTGEILRTIAVRQPTSVALSPDGRALAVGDEQGHVRVWWLADGRVVADLSAGPSRVLALAFGRDPVRRSEPGRPPGPEDWLLAAGDGGGTVTVWDLQRAVPRCYARSSLHYINLLAFSPDGMTLAGAGPWLIYLWDLASGRPFLTIRANNQNNGLVFAPDGRRLAVSQVESFGHPDRVTVWELDDGRGLRVLRGLPTLAGNLTIAPDGKRSAALSHDWHVAVWDHAAGRLIGLWDGPQGSFVESASLAFSPDGRRLAVSAGHEARLWDLDAGRLLQTWMLPEGLSEALSYPAPDRLLLARQEAIDMRNWLFSPGHSGEHPPVVRTRNLMGPDPTRPLAELTEFNVWVQSLVADPDGSCFVIEGLAGQPGQLNRLVQAYDWETGHRVWEVPTRQPPSKNHLTGVRFDPTGSVVSLEPEPADPNRGPPGRLLLRMPARAPLGWSPGTLLGPGAEQLMDIVAGTPQEPGSRMLVLFQRGKPDPLLRIPVIPGPASVIRGWEFSRDGRFVVWGNSDGTLTACDLPAVQRRLAAIGLGW